MTEVQLLYAATASWGLSWGLCAFVLARSPMPPRPLLGIPGLRRSQGLQESAFFRLFEPVMRKVAGWMAALPFDNLRARAAKDIVAAGYFLGLTANELMAISVLASLAGLGGGLWIAAVLETSVVVALVGLLLGAWMPFAMISSEAASRKRQIQRELPTTIDLLALCMSAGLDFPGAIRRVTPKSARNRFALDDELRIILQEIDLGRARSRVLLAFGQRVPSEAVGEFVSAVVQSEQKGNPLAEVLTIQATVLRLRRTVMAEEAASRAAALMIAPLALLIVATLIIIGGPLILRIVAETGV